MKMPVLETKLNARSAEFQANAAVLRAAVDDLNLKLNVSAQGGGTAARAKHTARGKLLPRERVQMLLDPGTPFLSCRLLPRSICTPTVTALTAHRAQA